MSLSAHKKRYIYLFLVLWLVLSILGTLVIWESSFWKAFKVAGYSMEPTLQKGDCFLVYKKAYTKKQSPQRGDIIVFVFPQDQSRVFILRIIAIPGNTIAIKDQRVVLNGKYLEENYIKPVSSDTGKSGKNMDNMAEIKVPPGKYFVLGDNRDVSYDSRSWGLVEDDAIIGKAMFIYYSPDIKRIMSKIR